MQVISRLGMPGGAPAHEPGARLIASIDVEWSKNYRITDGNRAFCYSIVWLSVPASDDPRVLDAGLPFQFTSVYLDREDERAQLVDLAATDITTAMQTADLITGHQLCSDLAVLAANAGANPPAAVCKARQAWRDRRTDPAARIVDTRFDTDAVLTGRSRRLVDVCEELHLDVTQPELARKSMTALHRDWLTTGDTEARERVTVLNLRHSLSTALVGLHATGQASWSRPLNVNRILAAELGPDLAWVHHPTFRTLTCDTKPLVGGNEAP